MKILAINQGTKGSTGKIIKKIQDAIKDDAEYIIASPITKTNRKLKKNDKTIVIGNYYTRLLNVLLSRITGYSGCFSIVTTYFFLKKVKNMNFDIFHLNNLHDSYINIPMLFNFIKKRNIKIVWTFHDCWPFTGHCTHFQLESCEKWKTKCCNCKIYRKYPKSYFDNSKYMFRIKKKLFTSVDSMTIITPSVWLNNLVKESFLCKYNVLTINNGIDLDVFKYRKSNFKKKLNIENKYIVLGVAYVWNIQKGLNIFIELSKLLSNNYVIVLVGVDKNTKADLPNNIISIERTDSQKSLAEIYSSADVFLNPTKEDNFPTVNMEAIACGTPVITFDTGGCKEIINNKTGFVVQENINEIHTLIDDICENKPIKRSDCINEAKKFCDKIKIEEYVEVFREVDKK